eukprot:4972962-Pleurochrysis_carterae.AAC.1
MKRLSRMISLASVIVEPTLRNQRRKSAPDGGAGADASDGGRGDAGAAAPHAPEQGEDQLKVAAPIATSRVESACGMRLLRILCGGPRLPFVCVRLQAVCGFIPALLDAGLEVTLLTGECDANFLANSLLPHEAAAYKQAWVKENDRDAAITSKSVVIEHGNPCLMRKWTQRPLWVIARCAGQCVLVRYK